MTNYEYLINLSPELMAKLFARLSMGDTGRYDDWLEWMSKPAYIQQWLSILCKDLPA